MARPSLEPSPWLRSGAAPNHHPSPTEPLSLSLPPWSRTQATRRPGSAAGRRGNRPARLGAGQQMPCPPLFPIFSLTLSPPLSLSLPSARPTAAGQARRRRAPPPPASVAGRPWTRSSSSTSTAAAVCVVLCVCDAVCVWGGGCVYAVVCVCV